MPIRAFCPSCQAEFHLQEDSAGITVRCGTCLNTFAVPLNAPAVTVTAPVPPPIERPRALHEDRPRRPRRDYDEDDYDYDRPSRNRRRYRKTDNSGGTVLLVLGLVFGIKFAIICMVVFFAMLSAEHAPPQPAPPRPPWPNDNGPVFVNPQGPNQWQPVQPQPVAPRPRPWQQQQQFNRPVGPPQVPAPQQPGGFR